MNKDNRINVSETNNSALTENALLGQYDREIQAIEAKKAKLKETIANLTETAKMLAKKRSALAKIIAPVGMILCLMLAGCESSSSYYADEANIDCREACERVGGRLTLIRVNERAAGNGFECECTFDQEQE